MLEYDCFKVNSSQKLCFFLDLGRKSFLDCDGYKILYSLAVESLDSKYCIIISVLVVLCQFLFILTVIASLSCNILNELVSITHSKRWDILDQSIKPMIHNLQYSLCNKTSIRIFNKCQFMIRYTVKQTVKEYQKNLLVKSLNKARQPFIDKTAY